MRLRALQDSPLAFGSTYEREANFSHSDWLLRIERWNGEAGVGFLALDYELPCGIAGCLLESVEGGVPELVSMWIAPTHRRAGVGTLLVRDVIEWARSRKAQALRLMVTGTNQPAIDFYTRLGFAMTGRTQPFPNDPATAELEVALSLE